VQELAMAFVISAACRWFDTPSPVPPKLVGVRLVAAERPPSTPWRKRLFGFPLTPFFVHTGSHLAVSAARFALPTAELLVSVRDG
jgi:XapX domain-containing protein